VSNLFDYVKWRGDLSFGNVPLCPVDALILSMLSYLNFDGIVPSDVRAEPVRILDVSQKYAARPSITGRKAFGIEDCESLLAQLAKSERFGSLRVLGAQKNSDRESGVQFGAVSFLLPGQRIFVAFEGTDDTIVGWKEDFRMSYECPVPAQKEALLYLSTVAAAYPQRRIYVGGHSKGGNLAMYALAGLEAEKRLQIEHVWIMDAPGFAPDVFDVSRLDWFRGITTRLVPEFCIISRIYEVAFEDTVIVECMGTALMEHDLINWQLDGPKILTAPANSVISDKIMETIMRWAINETIDRRKLFISELFDALGAGGAKSVNDISGKGFLKVLEALANTSQETRDVAGDLARLMIRADS
jgi:hypothetical protein